MEIRTRFAPSPTGYMHIGNLRTALYEFLIAKAENGKFILRIEDTDQERLVEDATNIIYNTLNLTGLKYDEGPDIGGDFGPYIQSERMGLYIDYAKNLVEKGEAYYCFCTEERLSELKENLGGFLKYDRHCHDISAEEVAKKLADKTPFVIRQKMPTSGTTTFNDDVYGEITVENAELDDQILIKADGFPTYNFANVVDDHLMKITHVVRGSEYLSSTPKYNLLYNAFGWELPTYIHLPPVMRDANNKLSKRKGDKSFEDLLAEGYIPEAIINYIALLGWSPSDNQELFSMDELIKNFNIKGLSKSPSIFDLKKLAWFNSEYIKKMDFDEYFELVLPKMKETLKNEYDFKYIANLLKSRLETLNDVSSSIDFLDELPSYETSLYVHKKMKTTEESALEALNVAILFIETIEDFSEENIHNLLFDFIKEKGYKNGQVLWPLRTALSGKPSSPGGAVELMFILGKEETIKRIKTGITLLEGAL